MILTIVICAVTAGAFIYGLILNKQGKPTDLFPSLISTIGVLGTFIGIIWGLWNFDTSDISNSITELLDGLKTAFITSIAGMGFSFIFTVIVNKILNKEKIVTNDTDGILREILKSMNKNSEDLMKDLAYIVEEIQRNNQQTQQAFTNFSEQLQHNNTEALVKVMENVTDNFNSMMGELLNRLVAKNFEELNSSVERLNTWQQENKKMIQDLTDNYASMSDSFCDTARVLSEITQRADELTVSGGKLDNLINELQKSIIQDSHFAELTKGLEESIFMVKNATGLYQQSMNQLHGYFHSHKNTQDAIAALLTQLNNLNFEGKIKTALEEAITQIDEEYVRRFNTTLNSLDKCISAILDSHMGGNKMIQSGQQGNLF